MVVRISKKSREMMTLWRHRLTMVIICKIQILHTGAERRVVLLEKLII